MDYTVVDLDRMVRTVWGEVRSEPEEVWGAIAWVIRTRADWTGRPSWGNSIEEICTAPWQFSCWNPSDPNRVKVLNLKNSDAKYKKMESLCKEVVGDTLEDPVGGATHYCRSTAKPVWRKGLSPIITIGKYDFFVLD